MPVFELKYKDIHLWATFTLSTQEAKFITPSLERVVIPLKTSLYLMPFPGDIASMSRGVQEPLIMERGAGRERVIRSQI